MKEDNPETVRDVSAEIEFAQPKIPDQIAGKWFPDTPVKRGTRWFYLLIFVIMAGYIVFQVISVIMILLGNY
jgi:hypothetical protein